MMKESIFLKGMLSGSIQHPCFDQDKELTYVHGKRRRSAARCEVCNELLINISCRDHKMNVLEPFPQPGVDVPQMVYVSCFGKHSHPPPPPPECTMRKMNLLEEEVEADPKASPAVLRKRVEEKIQRHLTMAQEDERFTVFPTFLWGVAAARFVNSVRRNEKL